MRMLTNKTRLRQYRDILGLAHHQTKTVIKEFNKKQTLLQKEKVYICTKPEETK